MPKRTQLTEAERQQRRAADRAFVQQAVEQLRSSDGWQRWLATRRRFHSYSLRNQLLLAMQKPDTAVSFFEEAHRLDPRDVPTRIWLGETYLTLGRAVDAERQLAAATELQPASTAAWFWRGRAALALQDHAQAVRYLERALTLSSSPAIHYQLGPATGARGDRCWAEPHLKHRGDAASIGPDDPLIDSLRGMFDSGAAYLTRGLEAIERRDFGTAVANLRTASELSPRDPVVHLNLGTALFLSGDRPAARRAFETAVRIAPELPKPRYTLGLLAESDMRDTEAIAHFTAAVGLDPNYLEAHASLADALRRTGRVDASLPHYLKVLALNPGTSRSGMLTALGRCPAANSSGGRTSSTVTKP